MFVFLPLFIFKYLNGWVRTWKSFDKPIFTNRINGFKRFYTILDCRHYTGLRNIGGSIQASDMT